MSPQKKVPSVTLTVAEFHALVNPVIGLADSSGNLPVLCAVHLTTRGEYLCAEATDRFRAGIKRIKPEHGVPAEFDALVKLPDLKRLLQLFKPIRGRDPVDVTFTIEDNVLWATASGGLGFDFADMRIGSSLELAEFPKITSLFSQQLSPPTPGDGEVLNVGGDFGVNADYLASFKAAAGRHDTLVVRPPASVKRPLVVQVGDDFIGLLMQRRHVPRDAESSEFAPGWADLLADKPKTKRAAKKAVAAEAVPA